MAYLKPVGSLARDRKGQSDSNTTSMIIGALIAVILVYSLASTVVTRSENAALEVEAGSSDTSSAPLFRLGPLFWAIIGIGVASAVVIKSLKG